MDLESICNLELDIGEWRELRQHAKRPGIIAAIDGKITSLQSTIDALHFKTKNDKVGSSSPDSVTRTFSRMDQFAWDQKTNQVKIYITIPNITELPHDKVVVKFTQTSLDVQICDVPGTADKRLYIPKLFKTIDPKHSKYNIKKNMVFITLQKADSDLAWWTDLRPAEKTKGMPKAPEMDNADPGASLMNLMKNLYEEGDDDMKRTIAKAWTESQAKAGDPSALMNSI